MVRNLVNNTRIPEAVRFVLLMVFFIPVLLPLWVLSNPEYEQFRIAALFVMGSIMIAVLVISCLTEKR